MPEEKTGWKEIEATRDLPRRSYKAESIYSTPEELAEITGLDPAEFKKWAKIVAYKVDKRYPKIKAIDLVTVPNVFICADLFHHGGGSIWDTFISLGGLLDDIWEPNMESRGYKVVNADTSSNLLDAISENTKNIWGIRIYAHGNKDGYVGNSFWSAGTTQCYVIQKLYGNEYKIAYAQLKQCFGGFKGEISKEFNSKEAVDKYFRSHFNLQDFKKYSIFFENNIWKIVVYIDWRMEWHKVAKEVESYEGMNILSLDFGDLL